MKNRKPSSIPPITQPPAADQMAPVLRLLVGLPLPDRTQGEEAATMGRRPAPTHRLDATAWMGWVVVGLEVFAIPDEDDAERPVVPRLEVAVQMARRVLITLAMLRCRGNVTHAAHALGTSRRALRGHLKVAGLHPWPLVSPCIEDAHRGEAHEPAPDGGTDEG